MDTLSQTDSFCVLYEVNGSTKKLIGQTEVVADSLNPKWVKNIHVNYTFEVEQTLRLEVYDADDIEKLNDLSTHDFIGGYDFRLSQLVSSANQELVGALSNGGQNQVANVKIMATEVKPDSDSTQCSFSANLALSNSYYVFLVLNKKRNE